MRTLGRLNAAQSALHAAATFSLGQAIVRERERRSDAERAEAAVTAALDDWRDALSRGGLDPALLGLFAEAPQIRERELKSAHSELAKAEQRTGVERLRYGEGLARLKRIAHKRNKTRKRIFRKQEEKALAALEHSVGEREP
jgi:glutamyl-tRNA reductase